MTSEFNIQDWPTLKTQVNMAIRKNRRTSRIQVFSCNSLITLSRIWWWGRWCRCPLSACAWSRFRPWGCQGQGGWRCVALWPANVPRVSPVNRKYACNQKNPGHAAEKNSWAKCIMFDSPTYSSIRCSSLTSTLPFLTFSESFIFFYQLCLFI